MKILSLNQIDAVLLVVLKGSSTEQVYVPQFSSSSYGQATLTGNVINYSAYTQHYGGFFITKPRVQYEMRLYDAATGNTAWVATSLTRGNAYAHFDTLIDSLAGTAAKKLKTDGLLR